MPVPEQVERGSMTDEPTHANPSPSEPDSRGEIESASKNQTRQEGDFPPHYPDALVDSVIALTAAIRDLVARSPVSSEELLTAEQLGDLFRLSPRTLRDLAAAGLVPHHRIGKHYRFSRDDIAEILQTTKQVLKDRRPHRRAA
jgi:excisionase family DNA binding protein